MVMWLCLYALRHAVEVALQLIQLPAAITQIFGAGVEGLAAMVACNVIE
jgi:hypothetical protein